MATGKEFVMGARIRLTDGYTSPVSNMTSTTRQFKQTVDNTASSVTNLGHRAEVANGGVTSFAIGSRAAAMSSRSAAGGVMAFTAALLGLHNVVALIAGLLTFKLMYDWLVKSNAEMETYLNTLTVVLKSQERAKETLEWAVKFAAQTPFEIPQIVEATTRLETYGLTATKTLGIIGDMASVMGKPIMQAVEAVADAQTGEMERLKEFGITKDMLAKQSEKLGVKAVDKGGSIIDQKAFNAALFSLMEERYKGGMDMQSKTYKGMLSNLKDFIGSVGREMGQPIFAKFKEGLTSVLEWTNQLQEGGMFDKVKAGATAFADAVVAAMSWTGQFFQRIVTILGLLWPYIAPLFDFLVNTMVPAAVTVLGYFGQAVLMVADFFINYWEPIRALLEGVAIAIGLIMGPAWALVQLQKVWTAVQWALNLSMMANPLYLLVVGIGAVIGAVILLIRHWDTIGPMLWAGFKAVVDFFGGLLATALQAGGGFVTAFVDGIVGKASYLVDQVKGVFSRVRELMPFSDAKAGPFSQLTYSGRQIMATMAAGVQGGQGVLRDAVSTAFQGVGVNPAGSVATSAAGAGRTVTIDTLIGNLVLADVGNKDVKQLVDEIIEELHARLVAANDIAGTGDMGAIL